MAEREILDSWKQISDYLRRDVRTCQRYERELGLPVHRLDGSPRARVFAFKDEIDAWRAKIPRERATLLARALYFMGSKPGYAFLGLLLLLGLGAASDQALSACAAKRGRLSRLSIIVLPFQVGQDDVSLKKWIEGMPPLLVQELSGSKYFDVVPDDRMHALLGELGIVPGAPYSSADLRRLQQKSRASHAVIGMVLRAGPGLVITLNTRKLGSDEVFSTRIDCADETEVVAASGRMADRIKRDLGLTRTTQAGDFDAIGVPVTTSSLKAFQLYNEGRRYHVAALYDRSARIMRRAIAEDPEFALAWRSLAATLSSRGAETEAMECLKKALSLCGNVSMQERFFIRASYFQASSEYRRSLQVTHEWSSLFPDDTQALLLHGRASLFEEDAEGAMAVLNEGLSKGDRNPFMFYYGALACAAAGRFDEAMGISERGLSVHPGNRLIESGAVIDAIAAARYDEALGRLERMKREITDVRLELRTGDVLLLKGDTRAAERAYSGISGREPHALARLVCLALGEGRFARAAELAAGSADHTLRAAVASRRGRYSEAAEAAEEALRAAEQNGLCDRELIALQAAGEIAARSGRLDEARAFTVRLEAGGGRGFERARLRARHFLTGLVAGVEGRWEQASAELEAAAALLSRDVPYIDERRNLIGLETGSHAAILLAAAEAGEKAGDLAAALAHCRRLFALSGGRLQRPDLYALAHHAAGRIMQAQGDLEGARVYLSKFLELWKDADPGLPEVEDAKKRLAAL